MMRMRLRNGQTVRNNIRRAGRRLHRKVRSITKSYGLRVWKWQLVPPSTQQPLQMPCKEEKSKTGIRCSAKYGRGRSPLFTKGCVRRDRKGVVEAWGNTWGAEKREYGGKRGTGRWPRQAPSKWGQRRKEKEGEAAAASNPSDPSRRYESGNSPMPHVVS